MGVQRTGFDAWLTPIDPGTLAHKRDVWLHNPEQMYAAEPGFAAREREAVDECQARRRPAAARITPASGMPPLVALALTCTEDVCLLRAVDDNFVLASGCLTAPSYWRIDDKIGKPLLDVHAPVTSLKEKIGAVMLRFMARLRPGQVFERRNWFIHQSDAPFQVDPEHWDPACDTLFVRSERQTLTRLDCGIIVFTISVTCHPLNDIKRYPGAARDMKSSFAAMDDHEQRHFGYEQKAAQINAILEACTGPDAGAQAGEPSG